MIRTYLFSPVFIFLSVWVLGLLLYISGLSELVNVEPYFILLICSFLLVFLFFSFLFLGVSVRFNSKNLFWALNKNYSIYRNIALVFFLLGSIGFSLEVYFYWDLIPLFMQNKINTGTPNHYIHYLTQFSMYSSLLLIPLYFFSRQKIYLFLVIISGFELMVWLKRGEILPIVFCFVLALFFFLSVYNRKVIFYVLFLGLTSLFIIGFSIVGNMRIEYVLDNIYNQTLNERYFISDDVPSVFSWIYIYIATTLENARHILFEQNIDDLTYGGLLIYPFLAPFFKSDIQPSHYAHLAEDYGLTVVSFLGDAFNDFGILGIYIYTLCFFLLSTLAYRFVSRGIFGLAILVLVDMYVLWSVFANSLKNGVYGIGLIIFIFLSLLFERSYYDTKSVNHLR